MEYPVRVYGVNILERLLSDLLILVSFISILLFILLLFFSMIPLGHKFIGGVLTLSLMLSALLMNLTGSGVRQNRALVDLGFGCYFLTGLAFLVFGFIEDAGFYQLTGIALLVFYSVLFFVRRKAVRLRFNPRFFTLRQFETMIQVADTMIDGDGREAISSIEIAVNVDHMFSKIKSPAAIKEVRLVMFLIEWILPFIIFRLFPFSDLGTNERRLLVQKVIGKKGIFKNVGKVLKLFASIGYYGDPVGMSSIGFIPFEERPRSQGVSQEPHHYPDPNK